MDTFARHLSILILVFLFISTAAAQDKWVFAPPFEDKDNAEFEDHPATIGYQDDFEVRVSDLTGDFMIYCDPQVEGEDECIEPGSNLDDTGIDDRDWRLGMNACSFDVFIDGVEEVEIGSDRDDEIYPREVYGYILHSTGTIEGAGCVEPEKEKNVWIGYTGSGQEDVWGDSYGLVEMEGTTDNPHSGDYMLVTADEDDSFRHFEFTDETWDRSVCNVPEPEKGELMISSVNFGCNEWFTAEAEKGEILRAEDNYNLANIITPSSTDDICDESPDACSIITEDFGQQDLSRTYRNPDNVDIDKATPVNHRSGFLPQGDIILAQHESREEYEFHICREGQDATVEAEGETFQCIEDEGRWTSGPECEGVVLVEDANDEPTVAEDDWLVLYEEPVGEDDYECNIDIEQLDEGVHIDDIGEIDVDSEYLLSNAIDEPETFTCKDEDTNVDLEGDRQTSCNQVSFGNYGEFDKDCEEDFSDDLDACRDEPRCTTYDTQEGEFCDTQPLSHDEDWGEMEMVEYHPEPQYFNQLAQVNDIEPEPGAFIHADDFDHNFYNSEDGWTHEHQGLWDAENKYSQTSDNQIHRTGTWEERIANPGIYDGGSAQDKADAWTPANAGAENQDVLSTERHGSESVFDGGFAGKCIEEEAWQYEEGEDEWGCSGSVPWEQAMFMPTLENGSHVGMAIMPYNYKDPDTDGIDHVQDLGWDSYSQAYENFHGDGDSLDELRAMCWPGTLDQREERIEDENYISGTVNINPNMASPGTPTGIYGEIDVLVSSTYSCYWEYGTDNHDVVTDSGDVMEMHFPDRMEEVDSSINGEEVRDTFIQEHDISEDLEYTDVEWKEQMSEWGNPEVEQDWEPDF